MTMPSRNASWHMRATSVSSVREGFGSLVMFPLTGSDIIGTASRVSSVLPLLHYKAMSEPWSGSWTKVISSTEASHDGKSGSQHAFLPFCRCVRLAAVRDGSASCRQRARISAWPDIHEGRQACSCVSTGRGSKGAGREERKALIDCSNLCCTTSSTVCGAAGMGHYYCRVVVMRSRNYSYRLRHRQAVIANSNQMK